tara:strand:- start:137 stop:1606 length:1470 start_codon:yes stop_codon:yes gene_type:complete
MDKGHNILPKGVIGEICISGDGLARGYINKPKLTQEKFIPHPFIKKQRLYKTGDLGRWLNNGTIEFIGRKDDQVKIRGYRIEIGEIENEALAFDKIDQCVVLAKENNEHDKYLALYYTSKEQFSEELLRNFLAQNLPSYMVPSFFISIEKMPLTSNGKINKMSLPNPKNIDTGRETKYVVPRNEVEKQLVVIWEKILNRDKIGVKDDFFDLGGHSLNAIRLINSINIKFDKKISLSELYRNPTIEKLQQQIDIPNKKEIGRLIPFFDNPINGDNLFLIPPLIGIPIVFKNISVTLKDKWNCYGLQYPGIEKNEIPVSLVEEIAEYISNDILKVQKDGIYNILGYSMGANVAFEVVKIIEKKGFLCNLIIVDRPLFSNKHKGRLTFEGETLIETFLDANIISELLAEDKNHLEKMLNHYQEVLDKHRISGRVKSNITVFEIKRKGIFNKTKSWKNFTSGKFNKNILEGNHFTILNEEINHKKIKEALKNT